MGIIFDSSVIIAAEHRGHTVREILEQVKSVQGEIEIVLSVVTIAELVHGACRAKTQAQQVFSLSDFANVASLFDTAGDLITFLELRGDVAAREMYNVQDEVGNIARMIPHTEEVLRAHMSPTSPEVMQKTVKAFEEIASGKLLLSPDWRYGRPYSRL